MKNSLTILFLILSFFVLGQSVPNTTTFTLQNVVDAVNPTTDDLQDCFNDAVSAYFDPTYSGSKNSLLNFRNYNVCQTYVSSGSFTYMTNTNSLSVTYPAVDANDIVFIAAGHYSNSTMSISGWTAITVTYSSFRFTVFYKKFTTSDAGGSVNITSSDFVTKFATSHRIKAKSTNVVNHYYSSLSTPTDTFSGNSLTGSSCEMAVEFASLFISQSLGITPSSGWTVRTNQWQSAIGANSLTTYNYSSNTTTSSGTYTFTGTVPFGYIALIIE